MKLKTALLGAACAVAFAPAAFAERGADGNVNVLYWQAPSTLNPYLSSGTKDVETGSLIREGLAGFNEKGEVIARLAESVPTVENGGVAADLTSITWKLQPGLLWSDGTPVTSADAKFTWEYCTHPEGGCAQAARYEGITAIDTPDELTIVITFSGPKPNPYTAFVGGTSPILQAAQFANCLGAAASTCTEQNFGPIGTGPFVVTEFKTNDTVSLAANTNYRDPAKPAFATMTVKGGGDAEAAARAVMETGEFDYAWNTQINPELQAAMAGGGKGVFLNGFGTLVERIEMNMTDPSADLAEGERSTVKHPHPILSDIKVRQALSMAIDRAALIRSFGLAGWPMAAPVFWRCCTNCARAPAGCAGRSGARQSTPALQEHGDELRQLAYCRRRRGVGGVPLGQPPGHSATAGARLPGQPPHLAAADRATGRRVPAVCLRRARLRSLRAPRTAARLSIATPEPRPASGHPRRQPGPASAPAGP